MENATSKEFNKEDLKKMVEKAVTQRTVEIRKEMDTMKKDVVKEAKEYTNTVQAQASKTMGIQLSLLKKQLVATMQCIDSVGERLEAFAIDGIIDLSN